MILNRLGNKTNIAHKIHPHFPPHKIYYDLFFGAGGMYFNKPRSQYSIVNDLDSDVFNLFSVVKDKLDDFIFILDSTPMSEELFYYWMDNKESDSVNKALRFLFISSFSYLGKMDTFKLLHSNCATKQKLKSLIIKCSELFQNTMIRNKDFRDFLDGIQDDDAHIGKQDRFIYADAPYLDTTSTYNTPKWTKKDVVDLLDMLQTSKIKFAYSEFDHPFILEQAEKRGLNVIIIGERLNLKNRRTEILITNYKNQPTLF